MIKRIAAFFFLLYAGLWCLQQAPSRAAGWLPLAKSSGAVSTFMGTDAQTFNIGGGSSHTFSGVNIGTASVDRIVCVGVLVDFNNAIITAVTIGGVSATIEQLNTAKSSVGIACANVTTGATGNVVVTLNSGFDNIDIVVGYFTGQTGGGAATPINSNGNILFQAEPITIADTMVGGEVAMVVLGCARGSAPSAVTWSGTSSNSSLQNTSGTTTNNHQLDLQKITTMGTVSTTTSGASCSNANIASLVYVGFN